MEYRIPNELSLLDPPALRKRRRVFISASDRAAGGLRSRAFHVFVTFINAAIRFFS